MDHLSDLGSLLCAQFESLNVVWDRKVHLRTHERNCAKRNHQELLFEEEFLHFFDVFIRIHIFEGFNLSRPSRFYIVLGSFQEIQDSLIRGSSLSQPIIICINGSIDARQHSGFIDGSWGVSGIVVWIFQSGHWVRVIESWGHSCFVSLSCLGNTRVEVHRFFHVSI